MLPYVVRILVSVTALATLFGAACTSGTPDQRRGADLPTSPTALPTFTYADFQDLLSDLQGKVVVVNLWASWCGPCIAEAPGLARLSKQFAGKAQFIGVDLADQMGAARAFIEKYGWTYPSVADPNQDIKRGLGLLGQPDTLVYDRQGKRVQLYAGAVDEDALRTELTAAVGQSS